MSKRTTDPNEVDMKTFVGKTIAKVDTKAINCVTITFTDGERVLLEAENAGPPVGLIGLSAYKVPR